MNQNQEKLKKFIDLGLAEIKKSPEIFVEFRDLYYTIFNEVCPACDDCTGGLTDSFKKATKYYQNPKIMETVKSQFKIKGGGVIHSIHGSFVQSNLTDEAALKFLKESPDNINCFESYPKDWKEQAEKISSFTDDAIANQKALDKKAADEQKAVSDQAKKEAKTENPKPVKSEPAEDKKKNK